MSPTWKWALRAGEIGSGWGCGATTQGRLPSLAGMTQSEIVLTTRVGVLTPIPMNTLPSRITANTTLVIGPPAITTIFFHQASR